MSSSDPDQASLAAVDTRAFLLPGSGLSALLIHGLTGTPYEMRYLGERLAGAGLRVYGVKLAGHAGAPEELGTTTHHNWYESVVEGFERLRGYGDPIAVIGQSAGAVLAARLACDQREEVAGLVLLAPAFFLDRRSRLALKLLKVLGPLASRIYLRSSGPDLHDAAARHIHPSARLMPLSAPISLYELSAAVRPRLDKIIQPTLIIHSRRDHTCPLVNVDFLLEHLGAARKRAIILEESFHVISVDSEKERVAEETIGFLQPFRTQSRRAPGWQGAEKPRQGAIG